MTRTVRSLTMAVLAVALSLSALPAPRAQAANPALETVGHRGDRQNHPDNSWAGISSAFQLGADRVEIDVIYNRDGNTVFLAHDRFCGTAGIVPVYVDTSPASSVRQHCELPELGPTLANYKAAGWREFVIEIKETSASKQYVAGRVRSIVHDQGLQYDVWVSAFSTYQLDAIRNSGSPIKLMVVRLPGGFVGQDWIYQQYLNGYDGVNVNLGSWTSATAISTRNLGLVASGWSLGCACESQNSEAIDKDLSWYMTDRVADLVAKTS